MAEEFAVGDMVFAWDHSGIFEYQVVRVAATSICLCDLPSGNLIVKTKDRVHLTK